MKIQAVVDFAFGLRKRSKKRGPLALRAEDSLVRDLVREPRDALDENSGH